MLSEIKAFVQDASNQKVENLEKIEVYIEEALTEKEHFSLLLSRPVQTPQSIGINANFEQAWARVYQDLIDMRIAIKKANGLS